MDPSSRPHIKNMVCSKYRVCVMLNDNDSIPEIPQFLQCPDQFLIIPLVETDTRLIEYIQDPGQPGSDLGG